MSKNPPVLKSLVLDMAVSRIMSIVTLLCAVANCTSVLLAVPTLFNVNLVPVCPAKDDTYVASTSSTNTLISVACSVAKGTENVCCAVEPTV